MTMDEINKMIANYESKWGKLGHTNIMNPEKNTIQHSGINKDISQGGNKTMSRMNNDLIAFRQKVAAGKERNKLVHRSTIDVNSINEKNYEQLMESHTLIHAQNPLYGQQNPNAKYYKREGQPGKYRYYYTKEEWDTAHKQGSASTEANRAAQERQQYENNKKATNKPTSSENIALGDSIRQLQEAERQGGGSAAADVYLKSPKYKETVDMFDKMAKKGYDINKLTAEDIDKEMGKGTAARLKGVDEFNAISKENKKDFENAVNTQFKKDIERIANESRERSEKAKNTISDRDAAIKAGQKAEQERQKLEEAKKNVNKEIDELRNNTNDNVYDGTDLSNALKRNLNQDKIDDLGSELGGILTEYYKVVDNNDDSDEGSKLKRKAWDEYFNKRDKIFEKYGIKFGSKEYSDALKVSEEIEKEYEKKHKYDTSADARIKKNIKEKEYNKNGSLKQSTSGKALITNSAMGDELMDEYSLFQKKVKAGKERNRLAHSTTISPAELNSRYEKELESHGILVHGGNYKYYNKIDLPNGTTRYFYTKAEWDAYQEGNERSKYEQQKKNFENNKKAAEAAGDRYKKPEQKPLPKSATMTDEERKEMYEGLAKKAKIHNQQVKNYENNKEAAKHAGDRWNKLLKSMPEVKDAPGENIKDKPEKPDPVPAANVIEQEMVQEVQDQTVNKQETINYILNDFANSKNANNWAQAKAWCDVYGSKGNEEILKENNEIMQELYTNMYAMVANEYDESTAVELLNLMDIELQNIYNSYYNTYWTMYQSQLASQAALGF